MSDKQDKDLANPDDWDYESAERRPGLKNKARVVVSVAFSRDDFNLVTEHAAGAGKPVSTFIRDTVLDHSEGRVVVPAEISGGTGYGFGTVIFSGEIGTATLAPSQDLGDRAPDGNVELQEVSV